jgi:hypothetical protein
MQPATDSNPQFIPTRQDKQQLNTTGEERDDAAFNESNTTSKNIIR